jgi:hypothetical protein
LYYTQRGKLRGQPTAQTQQRNGAYLALGWTIFALGCALMAVRGFIMFINWFAG